MRSRLAVAALAFPLLAPMAVLAQGVTIEHQEIGCIVAGKYPKMNACFAPTSSVKKARVYFRPETLTQWYYVDMTSDAPCFSGVLLRPSKALIDKKIYYYVDVQGLGAARTPEYGPVVVASEEDCRTKLPIAPLSATGPAAVYPSLPAGFVGGAGVSSTVIGGGVAAAAAVAGGALLLTGDDSPGATTPATNPPATNPPATTPPPPTTPPDTTPGRPPGLSLTCQATPRNGEAPLRVEFATFVSGGTGTYEFLWTFGDGATSSNPNPAHTFTSAGVFDSTVRVLSGDLIATCSRPITVTTTPTPVPPTTVPPTTTPASFKLAVTLAGTGTGSVAGPGIACPGDCLEPYAPGTVVTINATPASGSVFKQWTGDCTTTSPTCTVTMSADKNVTAQFELIRTLTVIGGASGSDTSASVTSNPAGISCTWTPNAPCTDTGTFVEGSTVVLTTVLQPPGTRVQWGGACSGATGLVCNLVINGNQTVTVDSFRLFQAPQDGSRTNLTSHLQLADGEGQVVVNGQVVSIVRFGAATLGGEARGGTNRVEAVLVRGAGRAGTWRFDFGGPSAVTPGSLRVLAGTVAVITGEGVTFRLSGKAGERVAFTFEVAP